MLPLVQAQLFQEGLAFQDVLVHQALPAVKEGEWKQFFFFPSESSTGIAWRKHLCILHSNCVRSFNILFIFCIMWNLTIEELISSIVLISQWKWYSSQTLNIYLLLEVLFLVYSRLGSAHPALKASCPAVYQYKKKIYIFCHNRFFLSQIVLSVYFITFLDFFKKSYAEILTVV